jgi:hypothetical protein
MPRKVLRALLVDALHDGCNRGRCCVVSSISIPAHHLSYLAMNFILPTDVSSPCLTCSASSEDGGLHLSGGRLGIHLQATSGCKGHGICFWSRLFFYMFTNTQHYGLSSSVCVKKISDKVSGVRTTCIFQSTFTVFDRDAPVFRLQNISILLGVSHRVLTNIDTMNARLAATMGRTNTIRMEV